MLALIPVYIDLNGIHDVSVYRENEDGSFTRTPGQPLRQLRGNFVGITNPIGTLVTQRYDRTERAWNTPTALPYSGRPKSFYAFVRDNLKKRRIIVATAQSTQGKNIRLFLNELKLSPSTGQGTLKLIIEKYLEAINLWQEEAVHEQAETASEPLQEEVTGPTAAEPEHQEQEPAVSEDNEKNTVIQVPTQTVSRPAPETPSATQAHKDQCQDRMKQLSKAELAKIRRLRKVFDH